MGSLEFTNKTARDQSVSIVVLVGELDAYSSPRLREALIAMIDAGSNRIVLDCSDLGYIDSSGLGALVAALKLSSEHYGILALAKPNASVLRILQITGLERLFPVYTDLDEACDACMLQPA